MTDAKRPLKDTNWRPLLRRKTKTTTKMQSDHKKTWYSLSPVNPESWLVGVLWSFHVSFRRGEGLGPLYMCVPRSTLLFMYEISVLMFISRFSVVFLSGCNWASWEAFPLTPNQILSLLSAGQTFSKSFLRHRGDVGRAKIVIFFLNGLPLRIQPSTCVSARDHSFMLWARPAATIRSDPGSDQIQDEVFLRFQCEQTCDVALK